MTVNYVITGANRGIGFALVKELSKDPNARVFATVRDPVKATDLSSFALEHKNVEVIKLTDVSSEEAVEEAVKVIESKLATDEGIDVLIPNAGISYSFETTLNTKPEVYLDTYKVNVLGNLIPVQKFYALMKKSQNREVFFTSSIGGSIGGILPNPIAPYGSSKAALNHLIRDLNLELKDEGFKFVAYHPGLVSTDLGNEAIIQTLNGDFEASKKLYGLCTPEESAAGIVQNVIKGLKEGKIDTENLWTFQGDKYPW